MNLGIGLGICDQSPQALNKIGPGWKLLSHVSATSPAPHKVSTTAPIDTSGASIIIVAVSRLDMTAATLTDSNGNTWTLQGPADDSVGELSFYYVITPLTSGAHTFTLTSPDSSFPAIAVVAYSCDPTLVISLDQTSSDTALAQSDLGTGEIDQLVPDELLITALEWFGGGLPTIGNADPDFTILEKIDSAGGVNFGVALATLIQVGGPIFVDPIWSNSGFANAATIILSFRADPV